MPDSGYFLQWEGNGKYITAMKWVYESSNASASLNKECMFDNINQPWKCMFAQETAKYMNIRMFPIQPIFDSWQIQQELRSNDAAQINNYGRNLVDNFVNTYVNSQQYSHLHGGFLESCYHHCNWDTKWHQIMIDGMAANQAQYEFYYGINTHDRLWIQHNTYPSCVSCSSCSACYGTETTNREDDNSNDEYTLLLRHKSTTNGYFSDLLYTTGLENENNPTANTYSIIGNINND
eukprot:482008_1